MRQGLLRIVMAFFFAMLAGGVSAQSWPVKPVRLIVPYPPGGATDFSARIYADHLTKIYGKAFVVENKAGAAGAIGAQYVANSTPDGYTLLLDAVGSDAINSLVASKRPSYRFPDAFEGISMATSTPLAVAVTSSLPVKTIQELVALAKSRPGVLTYGSAGVGSSQHMTAEKFQMDSGTKLLHVPYKGSGPAVSDLLGGQIDIVFDTLPTLLPQINSGKLRFLGVTTQKRAPSLAGLQTLQEQGIDGFDISTRYALLAPKGTPKEIVEGLSTEMQNIGRMADVRKSLAAQGAQAYTTTPHETDLALKKEVAMWSGVVARANIK